MNIDEVLQNKAIQTTNNIYSAVIVPNEGPANRIFAETAEALAKLLLPYNGTHTQVFPHYGSPLYISNGPQRYLLDPSGAVPLFETASSVEPDPDGFMTLEKSKKEATTVTRLSRFGDR